MNTQIEKLFGYERAELVGRPVETLVPERFRGNHSTLRGAFSNRPETRPMGAGRDLYGRCKNGSEFPVEIGLNAISNSNGQDDDLILATVVDITARKKAEEHLRFVMRELSHRTKNILAVVQVMAWQTARTSIDLEDFQERFAARIDALSFSHNLLVKGMWEGVEVEELIRAQLAPFLEGTREQLVTNGPTLLLKPDAAQNLGLALHELATNASKYGALLRPTGRITIGWDITLAAGGRRRFQMYWRESGGPKVNAPKRTGFGHVIIKETMEKALAGEATLDFRREGLLWTLNASGDRMFAAIDAAATNKESTEETLMTSDLLRGQRILVVEDDAFLAMSVDDMLQEAGAEVVGPAATIDSAKQLIAKGPLSAAILDIRLNEEEVWPIARLLANSDVPFVFYTGHFDSNALPVEWAERPVLTKPARPKQILGALADLVGAHH